MQTLVKIENLHRNAVKIEESDLAESIIRYGNQFHPFLQKIFEIDGELSEEIIKEQVQDSENLSRLKNVFLNLCIRETESFGKKMDEIERVFKLEKKEILLFKFLFELKYCEEKIYFSDLLEDKFSSQNRLATFLSLFLELPQEFIYHQLFNPTSNLNRFRLIVYSDGPVRESYYIKRYLLDPNIESFEDYLFPLPEGLRLDFPFSQAQKDEIQTMAELYKKNANYRTLLFTHSDTLSFQVARQIAEQSGLKLFYIDISPESKKWEIQYHALRSLDYLSCSGALIYLRLNYQIDRLEVGSALISAVERILGLTQARIIIHPENYRSESNVHVEIVNRVDSYINFTKSDKENREEIYALKLNGERMDDRYYRSEILMYQLERIFRLDLNREELEKQIIFFSRNDETQIQDLKNLCVDYDFFNTSFSPLEIKEAVRRFIDLTEEQKKMIKRTGFLLSGPPGTGKSLLAEAICIELGLTYKKVRLTDFSSAFVHETEKKTRNFFKENAHVQVLIFDEFDSVAMNRQSSSRQYEVTEVNEFLNCMDEHQGIIFATTNNPDRLDEAALRRFDFKIRFDYLNADMSLKMFFMLFKQLNLTTNEMNQVAKKLKNLRGITPAVLTNIHRQSILLGVMNLDSILHRLDEYLKSYKESIKLVGHC
jgi:SpoVK/Ycf46/Vps4 family AAA+-type ATPase